MRKPTHEDVSSDLTVCTSSDASTSSSLTQLEPSSSILVKIRLPPTALAVLVVLLRNPREWLYGYYIFRKTVRITHSAVYKALSLFNQAGWLERRWLLPGTGGARQEVRLKSEAIRDAAAVLASTSAKNFAKLARHLEE